MDGGRNQNGNKKISRDKNGNTKCQSVWDVAIAVLRGKL